MNFEWGDAVTEFTENNRRNSKFIIQNSSKRFRHIKIKECLFVYRVLAQIETYVHTRLDFDTQAYAIIRQHPFNLSHGRTHEAASRPGYKATVVQQAFHPVAAVGVYHLAVFCHDDVRGFVTVLPHVVAAQVERSTCQRILGEGDVAEYVLGLCGPGEYLRLPTDLY